MKTVSFDTHAVVTYLGGQPGWEDVVELLDEATQGSTKLYLSAVNWGETLYIVERRQGEAQAEKVIRELDRLPVEIVAADRCLTRAAARLKAQGGASYADCYAAALALLEDGAVATGDPEFETFEEKIPVRWIPRRAG